MENKIQPDDTGPEAVRENPRILRQGLEGPEATAALMLLVCDELRRLAACRMAQERPGQTLQAAAPVNELNLRLIKKPEEEL